MTARSVRTGATYTFRPVLLDKIDPPYNVREGDRVRVVKLPGCPRPGVMGHCHVVHAGTGEFAGLVHCNSLT